MFDLEKSIAEWRQQMLAAGIKTPVPLEELEIHLCEEIERQARQGLSPTKAFETAVKKIGQVRELEAEFKKTEESLETRMVKLLGFACVAVAALFSVWICFFLFSRNFDWLAKISGATALATTVLSWYYNDGFLPVIRNHWVRAAIGIACWVGCVIWIQFFIANFVPRMLLQPGSGAIIFLWGWTIMAVLGGIGFGLEKAARKSTAT
jgi:hypothetical protein